MQTTMSRYGFHAGSSIPEINPTTQANADTLNKQSFLRMQQSAGSLRIPTLQTFPPHQMIQPNLPINTPANAQVWEVSQNNRNPCKSAEPTRTNLQIYRGFITLPLLDGIFRLPLCPVLRFEDSPFYKNLDVIVPPTIMIPSEYNFTPGKRIYERLLDFRINSDQAETITYHSHRLDNNRRDFGVQVLVRFGKLESSILPQVAAASARDASVSALPPFADSMPIHLNIFVNVKPAALPPLLPTCRPNMDGRRHARPVDITSLLRVSPSVSNHVKLSWSHDYSTFSYNFFAIYLVQKHSIQELCDVLQTYAYRSASVIKKQIVDKLTSNVITCGIEEDSDDDLQIQNTLPVQLLCPLSKCRIKLPVRGQRCQHIQCYDADTYLLINERKPSWKCPVCDSFALFHELFVDGLLMDILANKESQDVEEIVFNEDGSWTTMKLTGGSRISRRLEVSSPSAKNSDVAAFPDRAVSGLKRNFVERTNIGACNENAGDVEVTIDLTASDEEDEAVAKRQPLPPPPPSALSLPPPSTTQRVSSVSIMGHGGLAPQHSVSQHHHHHHQQQQHYRGHERQPPYRPASGSSNSMRYAHSSSLSSIPSTAYPVDAKPDPRRAYLASLLAPYPIPTSRPCSHSATSSPRTPQSLGGVPVAVGGALQKYAPLQSSASASASSIATAAITSVPNSFLSSASPTHMAIDLATTKELFLKLSALYPHLTSQQIAESLAVLKMHECDRYAGHHQHHIPPPTTAHQNGLSLPLPRRSVLLPNTAHATSLQQCRPTTTVVPPPSSRYTSSSLFDIWPSSPPDTVVLTPPFPTRHPSLFSASLSPPCAHSNHPSSPPHQGDPRHPVEGLLGLSNPSGWSAASR